MQASERSTARPGVANVIDELDVGALGRALWRKKRWVVGLTFLAGLIAFVAVNLIVPRYKSEARVLIETRENIFLRPDAEKSTERGTTVDPEAVTSQVQLILSRDLARDVIKILKLGERAEFDPVLRGPSLIQAVLVHLGAIKDPMSQTPEERVLKSYFDRLVAFSVDKSRVIAIEFESEDPDLAAQVTNAIAEGYLSIQRSAKQDQSRSASRWLAGEIESLRQKVADAESKAEQYRSRANLMIGTNNTTLSNQQLGEFNAQVGTARTQRIEAESKARFIREALKSGTTIEFSDVVNSELMRKLSEQRVTLRAQLAEQSSTLLDQHPRIKELRAQIADLERQLRVEADRLARSLENDARMTEARVQSLSAGFDQLKNQAASINEQDVQLRALERDAKSQRDLLESYLAKYREATARDSVGAASAEARIISSAIVSNTPAYPKKFATVLIAALAMFVLSSGFILSGELLSVASGEHAVRIGPARDVFAAPAPALVPIQAIDLAQPSANAPVTTAIVEARPPEVPAYLAPRRRVDDKGAVDGVPRETMDSLVKEFRAAGASACRIAVVGTRRNVGTTQAAISLARKLSEQGKAVLVDLALPSPNLSAISSEPSAPGLSEAVGGQASFGQIITRDRLSDVHVIMAGHLTGDIPAILNSPRLVVALEALARSYDFVVVDAGALPDIPAERFAQITQAAVLIAEQGNDPAVVKARAELTDAGYNSVKVLEGIQDKADVKRDVKDIGSRAAA